MSRRRAARAGHARPPRRRGRDARRRHRLHRGNHGRRAAARRQARRDGDAQRARAPVRARPILEIIAIDPEGAKPARPRWFDLDNIALQAELAERPRLIHWVARTTGIERAAAACAVPLGTVHPMARGTYRWRITIPDDGSLPAKGIVPTLIEWDVPQHPADIAAEVERVDRRSRRGASRSRRDPRGARRARPRRRAAGDLRPRRATRGDAAHAARHRDALIPPAAAGTGPLLGVAQLPPAISTAADSRPAAA